ncbi:MAG: sulfatase-like hydrolase/transferase [Dysgonamonadaceae bacterium]|jgi:arylsulfatase|nr:sulfatase-like hydrolase/transferase [Dysgonamonadaceae bacterium]
MMKKTNILLAATSLLPATTFLSCSEKRYVDTANDMNRPNILFILADDLGWSDLGSYGSEVPTPNLDALAAKGIRFTQFHNSAKSFPSRANLLTGLYAQQVGYHRFFKGPMENSITLGEYLQSAGYLTMWSGKHHGAENPRTRGFDHYFGLKDGSSNHFNPGHQRPNEEVPIHKRDRIWAIEDREMMQYTPESMDFYTTDYFTNYALKWLDKYRNNRRPFFLYMSYTSPHDPLMAWVEDIEKFRGKYLEGYEIIRQRRFEKQLEIGLIDERFVLSEATYQDWDKLTPAQRREEDLKMAVYAAMIYNLDYNIGRIINKLKEQGKYENTIIMFSSDNGASGEVVTERASYGPIGSISNWVSLGPDWANVANTPLREMKNSSFQGGICIPLIVSWERGLKNPGRVSEFLGHFIDIMPTIVDIVGAPYPEGTESPGTGIVLPYEGESFLSVIKDEQIVRQRPLFWEWLENQAARDGRWKILRERISDDWALFDMENDPSETNNLAKQNPEIVERLDTMFREWQKRVTITEGQRFFIKSRNRN